jgi:tryptophan synthase alpha chain
VVGSALVEALRLSLARNGKARPGSVKAVTGLVAELAKGVRSARKTAAKRQR